MWPTVDHGEPLQVLVGAQLLCGALGHTKRQRADPALHQVHVAGVQEENKPWESGSQEVRKSANQRARPLLPTPHSLPVCVVQATELHALQRLVPSTARVAVAVVAREQASSASGGHCETTDTTLEMGRQTDS